MRAALILLPAVAALLVAEPPPKPAELHPPLTPEQAQREFRLDPGLRIELVAAEPQIESPVAMAFDEDGRLWVVEMRDYPNGPAPGKPPEGRIKVLEDRDGDGRYETSTVFADGLLFANGLLPWRGGLLVTAAPHIVWLRDRDGDGKADRRDVLFEGFAALNPQLRVSFPILGIDNWIYVANGLRGGQVVRTSTPLPFSAERQSAKGEAKPINLSGMDFRFDLIHDRYEAVSGMGQYGNTFDDWGRRFVCDNRHHLRHLVIENRYLKRNPYLAAPAVVQDISELEEGPLSSGGKVYPLSKNWTTSSLHAGRFTAACGVFIYTGDLLPETYRGAAFTCEPTGNLVHMEVLRPNGATFRSKPARDKVEFLATPDDWFRPVSMALGPDGALYVVDMYRAVIEHPEFMPAELKNRPDLTLGKDKGRIWRIVPEKHQTKASRPHLGQKSSEELAGLLRDRNAWTRMTAHRLLLERQDRGVVKTLRGLTSSAEAFHRLHALWLLDGYGALDEGTLAAALAQERSEPVLEQLVRLAEPWLAKSERIREAVLRQAEHDNPRLRFQVALTLGEWDDDRILEPLARVALRGADDPWTRLAVASSVPKRAGALIDVLCQEKHGLTKEASAGRFALLQELCVLAGARQDVAEVSRLLETLSGLTAKDRLHWQMIGLTGLAEGVGRRGTQLADFLKKLPPEKTAEALALLSRAGTLAADPKRDSADRLAAVRLLAHAPWEIAEPALTRLLPDETLQDLRLAAVRALAAHSRAEVPGLLMKSWPSYTPALRREVAEAMLRQPDRIRFFLKEVEAGRVKPGDLDALRTRQLVNHKQPDIQQLARKLLQENLPAERKQVLEKYQAALQLKGDAARGKAVFQKHCATCHRVAGVGVDVGPDIGDTRTKTPAMLLSDILNPNQAIDSNYINYQVVTKNGKSYTGIIAAETASSITLRRAENQSDTILRQDIEQIESTGISLMPEGLEKSITVEEMADLIHFLKNWRYLEGNVPLGGEAPRPR
jgi:putative membrane-bound dehydrogenase-like protein